MRHGYASFLLAHCLRRFNGERTLAAVYHLFSGKKSAQTLQDSKWFRLEPFFGTWKDVTVAELETAAQALAEQRLAAPGDNRTYRLTEAGERWLDGQEMLLPRHLNGWRYHEIDQLFWQRLSLVGQTLSNLVYGQRFTPICRDERTLLWVKHYVLANGSRQALAAAFYNEFIRLLRAVSEEEATVFTLRLTSAARIGWTAEQIAAYLQTDALYVQFQFRNVLHYMMAEAEAGRAPLMAEMMAGLVPVQLTQSAQKTYEWLKKRKTIEEIAALRRLKRSTIEDHIVEIAANVPGFSIAPFVADEKAASIQAAARALGTRKLKRIREALGGAASYFEIRLVLAKEVGRWMN
ncbi:Rrf2 family transcriptional regulator [Geobacillus sp. 46C-IIa]|uniref:helix-turn-helix domain-containing protein n=1 Tax=Geobacillus sp. 46C-IIa TaxID=1963025 RepID=UPI0009BD4023|nr:helix-turn-helix domain-containing protein [Geobacillus sp. 46C-IIa]OQP05963.1 Rrf2 family transcriptional regulator [Geobacillus sp. 46C-IIa]QNU29022.1 helix-turn-helix domain-containing protein [Geobacillus sp. 46C-IIa]